MYEQLTQEEMEQEAVKLLHQVQPANTSLTQEITRFIQKETTKALSGERITHTRIYFDVSASMKTDDFWPWDQQREFIKNTIPTAIDPFEETRKERVKDVKVAMDYVDSFRSDLRPSTPTRQLYKNDLAAHVAACIQDPVNMKRLNITIFTDGQPNDRYHPSMTDTTEWATLELHKNGLEPKEFLGVSYVIITKDLGVMACYKQLDDRTLWGSDIQVECDLSNAVFPYLIIALGGPDKQVVINMILAANKSTALDGAAERVVLGPAKSITELMDAYIKKGFVVEA